jgi:oxaloacetate decarboxylase beta subunit
LSHAVGQDGFLSVLYNAGIASELFPVLLFIGIGAMIDFNPLFTQPVTLFFGAAAQFGIFMAMLLAVLCNFILPDPFTIREAAAIGIIGAADGPSAIFIGQLFAPKYMGSIMVAAYSYMSLVPIIQPPVVRALTTRKERMIRMSADYEKKAPKYVRILFPIIVTLVAGIIAPMSTSLIGALMFGNLIRECGVTEKLSQTAQNELSNLITLLLGIAIGGTMYAQSFITFHTAVIMGIGLLAFVFDTAGGVLFAKLANLFLPEHRKVNPMVGACGISAFPMSARIIQKMAQKEDPTNFILMPAIGANVAGQIGSIIAAAMILSIFK